MITEFAAALHTVYLTGDPLALAAAPAPASSSSSAPAAPTAGIDYTQFKPNGNAVPRSDLFGTIMDGLMYVGFISAGIAGIAGIIVWMLGDQISHHLSAEGKKWILRGFVGAIGLGSFGAIMNFFATA